MSFIRPEIHAMAARWRELVWAAGFGALGLYWALATGGVLQMLGWALCGLAGGLAVVGVQRGRFRHGAGGVGVVQVDEGQITYFGTHTGGAVAIHSLDWIALDKGQTPPVWQFNHPGLMCLEIPMNAEGNEALFDVFAQIDGVSMAKMNDALRAPHDHRVVIWRDKDAPGIDTVAINHHH